MSKPFYKIIAVNDDVDTCSCCGRTNLKRVAWVSVRIDGVDHDPAPYGTTCAAKAVANGCGGNEYDKAANESAAKSAISLAAKTKKVSPVYSF